MIHKLSGATWRAALTFLTILGMPLQAAEQPHDFSLLLPLNVSGEGPWYRFSVPLQVQLAAQYPDLRDLRVFNAAGEPLAYALTAGQARHEHTLTSHTVSSFPLYAPGKQSTTGIDVRVQRDAHGTIVEVTTDGPAGKALPNKTRRGWLLDGSAIDAPLERLVLDWAELDGFQRFEIEASDDLQRWRNWGEGRIAQLHFGGDRITQREVRLPRHKSRYLRLTWRDPAQAPVLRSAQLWSGSTTRRSAPLIWSQPLTARPIGEHEFVWELPMALPLERLRIPLTEDNLLLPVTLQVRTDQTRRWRHLTRGLLYRVTQQGRELLQDELELLGRAPIKELKLQVDPRGGGFGSQVPHLLFGMRGTELVFLARGDGPYLLAVGKADAQPADLPLATLIPGRQNRDLVKLPEAKLSTPIGLSTTQAPTSPAGATSDWKRIGLWAVLLGGVLVLVLMAWNLLRSRKTEG